MAAASEVPELPDSVAPIVRASAASAVTEYVRRLVFDETLREGDRVPQSAIAAKLGLSRIPVRESLVALEREGVVTIEPHRGAFVNRFDEDAIRDHYEMYGLIYGQAARRSAERPDPAALAALREAEAAVAAADDAAAMLAGASAFRDGLMRAAGSPCFAGLMRSLAGIVPGNFFAEVPASIPIAKAGFRAILGAIEGGDGDAAAADCARMMSAHGPNVNRVRAERRAARESGEDGGGNASDG